MEKDQPEHKESFGRFRKRFYGTAAGALTAASLALGALFGSPGELLAAENDGDDESFQTAAVSMGKRLAPGAGQAGAGEQRGMRARVRAFFLRQPVSIRGAVLFPLWCIGRVGLAALTTLFHALSPFVSAIIGVLFNILLVALLFAAAYKLLFPNRSLKNLFSKRNVLAFIICGLLLGVADTILKWYYPEYVTLSLCIKAGLGLTGMILLCRCAFEKKRKSVCTIS